MQISKLKGNGRCSLLNPDVQSSPLGGLLKVWVPSTPNAWGQAHTPNDPCSIHGFHMAGAWSLSWSAPVCLSLSQSLIVWGVDKRKQWDCGFCETKRSLHPITVPQPTFTWGQSDPYLNLIKQIVLMLKSDWISHIKSCYWTNCGCKSILHLHQHFKKVCKKRA